MNSLLICVGAAGAASTSNFFFRKSSNSEVSNSNGYLTLFYLFSFLFSLVIFPDIWKSDINFTMLLMGGIAGFFSVALMLLTAEALKTGPSGLTFAFQNASSVFPGIILYLIFGSEFGFLLLYLQFIGIFFVLLGLYLGSRSSSEESHPITSSWIKYALGCFVVQALALTFIQGRCVLFSCAGSSHFYSSLAIDQSADIWFMPGQFGVGLILQSIITFYKGQGIKKREILYGSMGGITNGLSTFLLLTATKYALPSQQGLLFPTFAVTTIILCNIWANRIYKEKFNFAANACCSLGILIGSLSTLPSLKL